MLVIVEHRDIALLDQRALDLKALGRLDIFQVDAAEGDGDATHCVDKGLRAFGLDFDVEYVDAGEALEQHTLAFHYRLGGQRAEVTETENRGTVGNNCHQVALAGVAVCQLRITRNFTHGFSHTRAVGQSQITSSGSGLGQFHTQFARAGLSVVLESGSFQIRHVGYSRFLL